MCDWAYHQEAQRRSKVLQRQSQSLQGFSNRRPDDVSSFGFNPDRIGLSEVGEEHLKFSQGTHRAYHNVDDYNLAVQRDLKWRAKILRDHNMYMGSQEFFNKSYKSKTDEEELKKRRMVLGAEKAKLKMPNYFSDQRQDCNYYQPPGAQNADNCPPTGYAPYEKAEQGKWGRQNISCDRTSVPKNKAKLNNATHDEIVCDLQCEMDKLGKTYPSQPPLGKVSNFSWQRPPRPTLVGKDKQEVCFPPLVELDINYPSQAPLGRSKNFLWQPPPPITYDAKKYGYPPTGENDRHAGLKPGPKFNYDIYRDLKWQAKWVNEDHIGTFTGVLQPPCDGVNNQN